MVAASCASLESDMSPDFMPIGNFGEEDIVVTVVVAVLGLSCEPFDPAPPDKWKARPCSVLYTCDFSSGISSQTLDCAVDTESAASVFGSF